MVSTTLPAGLITDTVPEPLLATYTYPLLLTATPFGSVPTVMVLTTTPAGLITDTVPAELLVT